MSVCAKTEPYVPCAAAVGMTRPVKWRASVDAVFQVGAVAHKIYWLALELRAILTDSWMYSHYFWMIWDSTGSLILTDFRSSTVTVNIPK